MTDLGNGISFDGRQRPIARTFRYSFGLQRQLPYKVILDASYVGSQTDHVAVSYNLNGLPMSVSQQGAANSKLLDTTVPNPFYGILPANSSLEASSTIAARYLYYPYPEFNTNNGTLDSTTGITMTSAPWPLSLRRAPTAGAEALQWRYCPLRGTHDDLLLRLLKEFSERRLSQ